MAKRILAPLDRTPEAEAVLPYVAALARGEGATVRLLHVAAVPDTVVNTEGQVLAYADQEMARVETESRDYLEAQEPRLSGVPVECAVRFGDPVEQILAEADAFGAEVIVVTSGHRRGLSRLLLGSTAGQLCSSTALPVLVVRPAS